MHQDDAKRGEARQVVDPAEFDIHAFASSHGLSLSQAMGLVDRFGTNAERLEREALKLRQA